MFPAALTPRRKLALAIALPGLAISYGVVFYAMRTGADPQLLLLRLPFAGTIALTIAFALAGGVVVTELARIGIRSSTAWSERRHFAIVLTISVASLVIQWFSLVWAAQRAGRAF